MPWQFLSRNLASFTLIGAIAAYIYPPAFLIFKDYFLWFFGATMFALGLVMKPEEAKDALAKPLSIFVGVSAQFTVMPALGFIIVGCAPGATASNVMSLLACFFLSGILVRRWYQMYFAGAKVLRC